MLTGFEQAGELEIGALRRLRAILEAASQHACDQRHDVEGDERHNILLARQPQGQKGLGQEEIIDREGGKGRDQRGGKAMEGPDYHDAEHEQQRRGDQPEIGLAPDSEARRDRDDEDARRKLAPAEVEA